MFRIRDFSRFTRVSVKMLRHYDRLGLLRPAFVDPHTRYRHYSARQLPRLQRILALRDLGFSLEHIADLLDERPRSLRRLLENRRAEVERELESAQQRLAQLDARLRAFEEDDATALPDVVVRAVPAVRVASRRARVPDLEGAVQELFETVERDARRAGVRESGPPLLLYHDRDHRETDADVEAAVPVAADAQRAGDSNIRVLPAIARAACLVYTGNYDGWGPALHGVMAWLEQQRLRPVGSTREVYLQFGARGAEELGLPPAYLAERVEDFVTELQVPVEADRSRSRGRLPRRGTRGVC